MLNSLNKIINNYSTLLKIWVKKKVNSWLFYKKIHKSNIFVMFKNKIIFEKIAFFKLKYLELNKIVFNKKWNAYCSSKQFNVDITSEIILYIDIYFVFLDEKNINLAST